MFPLFKFLNKKNPREFSSGLMMFYKLNLIHTQTTRLIARMYMMMD